MKGGDVQSKFPRNPFFHVQYDKVDKGIVYFLTWVTLGVKAGTAGKLSLNMGEQGSEQQGTRHT